MEHIAVGKLLPNLKVTVGKDEACIDNSEGKSCDKPDRNSDNSGGEDDVKIVRSWMDSLQNPKVYKNKGGAFTTGLDLMSESNIEKLDKRAERFGIEKEESSVSGENISSLYESMGVDIKSKTSVKLKNMRLDALHVRGINELNTHDVFQYFQDYGPASVEWINDFSCNVVWMDDATCVRALLGISQPLKNSQNAKIERLFQPDSSEQNKTTDQDESIELDQDVIKENPTSLSTQNESVMDVDDTKSHLSDEDSGSLDIPMPPGYWRLGIPHPKAKTILLRFATKDDKKLPGAEKRSTFYKKYGNPNYGGLKGLISSSRKRKIQAATNKRAVEQGSTKNQMSDEDSPNIVDVLAQKPRLLRMRMYADDEELKAKTSRNKTTESEKRSVHSRLGIKYTKDDLCHLGSYDRDEERTRSFLVNNHSTDTFISSGRISSWERKRNFSSHGQEDLRTKIRKLRTDNTEVSKHRSPLCVED